MKALKMAPQPFLSPSTPRWRVWFCPLAYRNPWKQFDVNLWTQAVFESLHALDLNGFSVGQQLILSDKHTQVAYVDFFNQDDAIIALVGLS